MGSTKSVDADVVYFRISNLKYPRNRLLRQHLQRAERVRVATIVRSQSGGKFKRVFTDYARLWADSRGARVIVLSEFSNSHALPARIVAWLRGARLVVDGFIGLYETAVEDWGRFSPHSAPALRLRMLDWLAVACADVYLVDTNVRRAAIRARYRRASKKVILSVPVGAPDWAKWRKPPAPVDHLRLLYYGNYIPLHGLPLFIEALAKVEQPWRLRMVGDGERRESIRSLVLQLGLADRVAFVDSMPEERLADEITDCDVVVGIFGDSVKARSVIANKVWQGLASGRYVLTQESEAVEELRAIVGDQLVVTKSGSAQDIAREISRLGKRELTTAIHPAVSSELREYVAERVERAIDEIIGSRAA